MGQKAIHACYIQANTPASVFESWKLEWGLIKILIEICLEEEVLKQKSTQSAV